MARKIELAIPALDIKEFSSLSDMFLYLENPLVRSEHLALITLADESELQSLLTRGNLVADIQSILVLAAGISPEATRSAHGLNPRILFCGTANIKVLQHIISRMVNRRLVSQARTGAGSRLDSTLSGPRNSNQNHV